MAHEGYLASIEKALADLVVPSVASFARGLFVRASVDTIPLVAIVVVPNEPADGEPIVVGDIDRAQLLQNLEEAIAAAVDENKEEASFSPFPPRTDAITDVFRERAKKMSVGAVAWCASTAVYRDGWDAIALVGAPRDELRQELEVRVGDAHASFTHSLQVVLARSVARELERSDGFWRVFSPNEDLDDLLRDAGENFVHVIARHLHKHPFAGFGINQFERINRIASLAYESAEGRGAVILSNRREDDLALTVRFVRPVPFAEPVWARKMLELSTEAVAVVADDELIYGLASRASATAARFWIEFVGRQTWNLCRGDAILMQTSLGVPSLSRTLLSRATFDDVVGRVFAHCDVDRDALWKLLEVAREHQAHGALLVFSTEADGEAKRLAGNGTPIEPIALDAESLAAATRIDGAMLIGADGRCHAIGVILDGEARVPGTPARGARFNSAVRYVTSPSAPLSVAVVMSEDGHLNLLPRLRRQIERAELERLFELIRQHRGDSVSAEVRAAARRLAQDYADYVPDDVWEAMKVADAAVSLFYARGPDARRTRFDKHPTDILSG